MAGVVDFLGPILERKRRENARRAGHARGRARARDTGEDRSRVAIARLRRGTGQALRVIAELKFKSPSAGILRARSPGAVASLCRAYEAGGAAAVSVLCDGPGFGGSVLDLRRAAAAVAVPLLFKEFVLHPLQIELAREVGAHMVLLIVRALPQTELEALVARTLELGMAPVVEAADEAELGRALATRAPILGVNARDLRSFRVSPEQARRAIELIPADRIAVHMSGVTSADELGRVASGRADAVLVGEGLMRAPSPGARLREWLSAVAVCCG